MSDEKRHSHHHHHHHHHRHESYCDGDDIVHRRRSHSSSGNAHHRETISVADANIGKNVHKSLIIFAIIVAFIAVYFNMARKNDKLKSEISALKDEIHQLNIENTKLNNRILIDNDLNNAE